MVVQEVEFCILCNVTIIYLSVCTHTLCALYEKRPLLLLNSRRRVPKDDDHIFLNPLFEHVTYLYFEGGHRFLQNIFCLF